MKKEILTGLAACGFLFCLSIMASDSFADTVSHSTAVISWKLIDVIKDGLGGRPVPEPATLLLLGAGLIGLAEMNRNKRS